MPSKPRVVRRLCSIRRNSHECQAPGNIPDLHSSLVYCGLSDAAVSLLEMIMIKWAIIFAVLALVMAVLGFGGLAGAFIDIAQILFWLAVLIAVIFFVLGYTVSKKVT